MCAGPLNKISEATADPQLRHRGMITEQEHRTAGPVPQIGTPIKFRERHAGPRAPAQAVGESTSSVLAAAGYSADEIGRLLDDGVAAEPAAVNASDW